MYGKGTNRNSCQVLRRAQKLELIQKNAREVVERRDNTTRADKVRFSFIDWQYDNVVRASAPNLDSQREVKFGALQMSVDIVSNPLHKLDATVARQKKTAQQLLKSMNENLSQLTVVMTAAMAALMDDLKTVLVVIAAAVLGRYQMHNRNNRNHETRVPASLRTSHSVT